MIRIGVLGTADIAKRRMIPAILKNSSFKYTGVAIAVKEEVYGLADTVDFQNIYNDKKKRGKEFCKEFGGKLYEGYETLLKSNDIDAVYIPLPPALHAQWTEKALFYGKHVLSEKPFTTSYTDAVRLLEQSGELAIVENYGFPYHSQCEVIKDAIKTGRIGEIRLIRATFGFPHRGAADFRYNQELGGGALLDCGGYTLKAASIFMQSDVKVVDSVLVTPEGADVDIYGSATLKDEVGNRAQVAFGMDNYYRCELEILGSKGMIKAPRFFTAPAEYDAPVVVMQKDGGEETIYAKDDQFVRILDVFLQCVSDKYFCKDTKNELLKQESLIEQCVSAE